MTVEGFDVSVWQGFIDWGRVPSSYKFAGIKAAEGLGGTDPYFAHNWSGAAARGLLRIAYHYLTPGLSGAAQADHLHAYVRSHGRFRPPSPDRAGDAVMLDLEAPTGAVPPAAIVHEAEQFVQRIIETTLCGVWLYCGFYYWRDSLLNPVSHLLHRCPLWLPDYAALPLDTRPIGWEQPSMWQRSETGQVPGISGNVDMDSFMGTMEQLVVLQSTGGRLGKHS